MAIIGVEPRLRIASLTLSPRSKPSNKSAKKNKKLTRKKCVQFIAFALGTVSLHMTTIPIVKHTEDDGSECSRQVCKLSLERIVSKKLNAPYRSGPSRNLD